jgi:hypothetical protein
LQERDAAIDDRVDRVDRGDGGGVNAVGHHAFHLSEHRLE